jgi:hypothetical protein
MARPFKQRDIIMEEIMENKAVEQVVKPVSMPAIVTNVGESHIMVMTPDEYREWSASQGRIMGRLPNQVTMPTEEEMRILINSGWNRARIKEKHGVSDAQIDALLVSMSNKERRDKVVVLH